VVRRFSRVRHVVFDWNGTLIDDCDLAVATVNVLLGERAMAPITRDQYRRAFRFPIRAFYRAIGIEVDEAAFARLMERYLSLFERQMDTCSLHAGAHETLAGLRAAGLGLSILSATQQDSLDRILRARELHGLFDHVAGLDHSLASDKRAIGRELAARLGAAPEEVLYVGDTDHDYEVAASLGWRFLFAEHGHQETAHGAPHCARTIAALADMLAHLESRDV
jgi:phosphoglycolate phosphatase